MNREPIAGASPAGRKTLAPAKGPIRRCAFEMDRENAESTTNPSRANRIAGARTSRNGNRPNSFDAAARPATAPGTPTASGPTTLSVPMVPSACAYMVAVAASGATSR